MAYDYAKYNRDYKKNHYDMVSFRIPKGTKAQLNKIASEQGKTTIQFIKDSIYHYLDDAGIERINLG